MTETQSEPLLGSGRSASLVGLPRSTLIVIHIARHSGRDSCQTFLSGTLRVNANLFQTDLCRNPGYRDVLSLPSLALDTRFPAGMTLLVYNDERSTWEP
jgi:hypothetical protein